MRSNVLMAIALAAASAALLACSGDDDDDGGAAPDAAPPASCSSQMFSKYGADAFLAVNDSIIDKAVAAPTSAVGTSFQELTAQPAERVAEFRANLAAFLVAVYGGPDDYEGPTMEEAHEGLAITSEQYDYFVASVVVPALADNGVPTSDIEDCFAPPVTDPAFKSSIIDK
jgi:hypothetical protein